jgi:hypothetical protein
MSVDRAAELTSAGTAHAVVFWVDYACRVADESRDGGAGDNYDLISTASSSHRQLIRKLLESVAITEEHVAVGAKVYVKASFGADHERYNKSSLTAGRNNQPALEPNVAQIFATICYDVYHPTHRILGEGC